MATTVRTSATLVRIDEERAYFFAGGTVLVRPPTDLGPWLLTWLPDDQKDPAYPGFTISPTVVEFPIDRGVGGILEWAAKQPWARRGAGEDVSAPAAPPQADVLPVPADEFAAFSERVRMDFGYRVAFAFEPDGSFSWAVLAEDGTQLRSGTADTWDDACLAILDSMTPPSSEARGDS